MLDCQENHEASTWIDNDFFSEVFQFFLWNSNGGCSICCGKKSAVTLSRG